MKDKYFEVEMSRYYKGDTRKVYRPASLNNPKDEAVMFINESFMMYSKELLKCKNCLVFWPQNIQVPIEIDNIHRVIKVEKPHNAFAKFFQENQISYLPTMEKWSSVNGAYIAEGACIGDNCIIFPGAYIGSEVKIGNNVYIGSGVKVVGDVIIGDNVVVRENAVIGADGLTTDRDVEGKALTIPQFGGVLIENDVQIGAATVIARGAIDYTIIKRGAKIDNCCFISHNVTVGEDVFIVGETIMFGSSSVGEKGFISGNVAIREGRHVGKKAKVGMGSVVTKDVEDEAIVKGNPAR